MLTTVKYDNMESAGKAFEVLESSDHCHFRHTIGDSIQTSKGLCPMVNDSSQVVTFDMRKSRKEGAKKTRRSDMDAYGCPCVQRIITSVDKLQDVSGQLFLQFPEYVHCHVSFETPNTTYYIGCVASDSLHPPLTIMKTMASGRRFPADPVKLPKHIESDTSSPILTNLTNTVRASPLLGYGVITKESEGSDVGRDSSHSIPSIFFNLVFYMRCWKAPMEEKELYRAVYYSHMFLLNMVGMPSKMKRSEYFLEVTNLAYTKRTTHPVSSGMYCSMEYYITTTNHWNFLIILSLMTAIIPLFLNLLIHDDFFTWSCIMSAGGRTYQEQSRRGRGGSCDGILTCTRADLVGNVISCVYISSNMVMNILSLVIMQTLPHHGSFGVQWHRYCALIMIHITFFVLTTLAWLLFQWKLCIDRRKEFWFKKVGPSMVGATDVGLTCLGDPVGFLRNGSSSEFDFRPARKWLNLRRVFPCIWALCYRVWMENRSLDIREWLYDTREFDEFGGISSDDVEGVETPVSDVLAYDAMDATEEGLFDLEAVEREDAYTDSVEGVRVIRFLGADIIVPKDSTKAE